MAAATKKQSTKGRTWHKLVDVPGVSGGEVKAYAAKSPNDALFFITDSKAVTAAGDNGALNVWRDDSGQWRCEFHRRLCTINSITTKSVRRVMAWMREWWPRMEN